MKSVREKAYAKINFCLNIVGTNDGYHMLDTVVSTINIFDIVTVSSRKDKAINIDMGRYSELEDENNNAYRAAKLYVDTYDTCGVDIKISKRIPIACGLGGSSADIAAVLRGIDRIYECGNIKDLADSLGSDSGYLLNGGYARLTGRGTEIHPFVCKNKYYMCIVCSSPINTKDCYITYDSIGSQNTKSDVKACIKGLVENDLDLIKANCGNDLYDSAVKLLPDLEKVKREMDGLSPRCCFMSGSGSAVVCIFDTVELCMWAKDILQKKFHNVFVTETV